MAVGKVECARAAAASASDAAVHETLVKSFKNEENELETRRERRSTDIL